MSRMRSVRFEVHEHNGSPYIDDDDFGFDAVIDVGGDFVADEKKRFLEAVCAVLNTNEACIPTADSMRRQAAPHAAPADKACSYCFGEGAVSMSTGYERRMCTLCKGTGRMPAQPESAPRSMFEGAPMKVVKWPELPSKPSRD